MSSKVIHFEIQADDIQRAKAFYEKAFGWKIEEYKSDNPAPMEYWMLYTGPGNEPGINGGMYKRPGDKKIYTYDCTISVENIDDAIKAVKESGGTINTEKMEMKGIGWFARGTDPEGNTFGLMQPTDWKPAA